MSQYTRYNTNPCFGPMRNTLFTTHPVAKLHDDVVSGSHGAPPVPLALSLSPPGLLVHILTPCQALVLRHSCDSELQEPGTRVWAMTASQGRPTRIWWADHIRVCDPGLSSLISLGHHNLSHSVRSKNITVRKSQQEVLKDSRPWE